MFMWINKKLKPILNTGNNLDFDQLKTLIGFDGTKLAMCMPKTFYSYDIEII